MDYKVHVAVVIGLLGFFYFLSLHRPRTAAPLPPGPKGLPLVGNLFDLPGNGEILWRAWAALKHPIASLTVGGQTIVLLNDLSVGAKRILSKLKSY